MTLETQNPKKTSDEIKKDLDFHQQNLSATEAKIAETQEKLKKITAQKESLSDQISDAEYEAFINDGTVPHETLKKIAERIQSSQQLTPREIAVYAGKGKEIEELLKEPASVADSEESVEETQHGDAHIVESKETKLPKEKNITDYKSFTTARGSVYTVLDNGKVSRYKSILNDKNYRAEDYGQSPEKAPSDIIFFFNQDSKEGQWLDDLQAYHPQYEKKMNQLIDVGVYKENSEGEYELVKNSAELGASFLFVRVMKTDPFKLKNVLTVNELKEFKERIFQFKNIEVGTILSSEKGNITNIPTFGFNTFDYRYNSEGKIASMHNGNKVIMIEEKRLSEEEIDEQIRMLKENKAGRQAEREELRKILEQLERESEPVAETENTDMESIDGMEEDEESPATMYEKLAAIINTTNAKNFNKKLDEFLYIEQGEDYDAALAEKKSFENIRTDTELRKAMRTRIQSADYKKFAPEEIYALRAARKKDRAEVQKVQAQLDKLKKDWKISKYKKTQKELREAGGQPNYKAAKEKILKEKEGAKEDTK